MIHEPKNVDEYYGEMAGEMKDLGEVMEGPMVDEEKGKKYYPSITIPSEQFPELAKKDIGDECVLKVKVVVTSKRIAESDGGKESEIGLELREAAIAEEQPEKEPEEKEPEKKPEPKPEEKPKPDLMDQALRT